MEMEIPKLARTVWETENTLNFVECPILNFHYFWLIKKLFNLLFGFNNTKVIY